MFKGTITHTAPNEMSILVQKGTDTKAIQDILAFQAAHEDTDLELAILSYAVMTKDSKQAQSEKTQLHDRVNYFLMSDGPVKVQATRKPQEKYPYDITLKGVKDIIRIDVTGKREDLTLETFIENWSLGPNSFALNPPDGNFTLRLKNHEQVFNAMKFNGPPRYIKETDFFVLEGVYLEGANNEPQIPPVMQREGMMESVPDHRVGVFLDWNHGNKSPI